jgi:hypothetical protein
MGRFADEGSNTFAMAAERSGNTHFVLLYSWIESVLTEQPKFLKI